jgi:ribosomal protein L37E
MRNRIYTVVIVVSAVAVAVIILMTRPASTGGIESIPESEQTWVKCTQCGAAYQMGKRRYFEQLEKKATASSGRMLVTPKLTCRECGKDGILRAVKCEKCGEVFFRNSVPADLADRCPKCGYSKTEAKRNARRKE